jgi:hypothetical protein
VPVPRLVIIGYFPFHTSPNNFRASRPASSLSAE